MIDRKKWVQRHNIEIDAIDFTSANYVGNGNLAYGFDITGMQCLYDLYEINHNPLMTMSTWGWHRRKGYTMDDLQMTLYDHPKGKVAYAVEPRKGNEEVYHWLRENPHRFNLMRVGLRLNGEEIKITDLANCSQKVDLFTGIAHSKFELNGHLCKVITMCDPQMDTLAFRIESELIASQQLSVSIRFPYGSSIISGSDWEAEKQHITELVPINKNRFKLLRTLDETSYEVNFYSKTSVKTNCKRQHDYQIVNSNDTFEFTLNITDIEHNDEECFEVIQAKTINFWKHFWNKVGAIDFAKVKDTRGIELERRIVLSLYQSIIHGSGAMPPQETGLACNSWYGKFHLEMHPLHSLYMPMWSISEHLKPSLKWYKEHLETAIKNARRNGYTGAKWPKMIASEGIDSPSWIATLLIWQQPHILYILSCVYQCELDDQLLYDYEELVIETANYMVELVVYNELKQCYELIEPVIPVQEEHDPKITKNPAFEVAYWNFGLRLAIDWLNALPKLPIRDEQIKKWQNVAERMALVPHHKGLYIAHERCQDTFEKFNRDHPSMLMAYGFIKDTRIDKELMWKTYQEVLKTWDFNTLWGWDFAMMAMTAIRLGNIEEAIEALLMETPKNTYVDNGHNYQKLRKDLPIYMPGNGSLLLAVGMLAAGTKDRPGVLFNHLKGWKGVVVEGISPIPY